MGADDDEGCPGHVFVLAEVIADERGARLIHACACGAVSYEPSRADQAGTVAGT